MYYIAVQAIGIIAMTMNVFSYQRKTYTGLMIMQFTGAVLFSVHYILLGAYIGGILNAVAVFRSVVYANREKFHSDNKLWIALFACFSVAAYILNFAVFGKEAIPRNFIVEILPVVGMISLTVGISRGTPKATRKALLVCSPCWLIYNIFNFSVGGIICEAMSIISAIVGMFRYDVRKKSQDIQN